MNKNSNQTWEKIKLGNIATEIRDSYLPNPNEHLTYIGLEHIDQGTLHLNSMGMSSSTQSNKKVFRDNDILFGSLRPYFRKVAKPKFPGVCSTDITVIRSKGDCSQEFLFYFIANQEFIDFATNVSYGTKMPRATWKILSESEWLLPPRHIQYKISTILSAYDDMIENNNRRIKILEEMARLIYKEWFVKFRFPGYEKVKMVESELGMIPEGWEVRNVLDIEGVNLIKAKVKRYDGVKEYFATANVEGNNIIKDGEMVTYDERPSRAQMQPEKNTIWFAKMRETYKVLCFTSANKEKAERSILSSGFAGLKVGRDIFGFAYFTVNSKEFHNQKDQFCTGATQMSSTIEGLNLIKIGLPDKNLVRSYSELTQPMIDQIIRLQQQNNIFRQTRDMLLPKLFSGEIDVSDLDIKLAGKKI